MQDAVVTLTFDFQPYTVRDQSGLRIRCLEIPTFFANGGTDASLSELRRLILAALAVRAQERQGLRKTA